MSQRMYEIEEFKDYHIKGEAGLDLVGHLVKCKVCGKKIIVEMLIESNFDTLPTNVQATCLECMKVCDEFREGNPKVTAQIEGWKKNAGIV